jgi:hypothetical protein
MAGKETISEIEAINIVGRTIFGDDWVGQAQLQEKQREGRRIVLIVMAGLSDDDRKLIEEYGPRPGKRGGLTIETCPAEKREGRDRALSRQHRMEAQRGAAMEWLIDKGLHDHGKGCDRKNIVEALKSDPPRTAADAAKRGAPEKFKAIGARMLSEVDSGDRTRAEIVKASGKTLRKWYGADKVTCKKAIGFAFPNSS